MNDKLERCRIIDKKELRRLVPYTPTHIARLEAVGKFPRRVHLGANRVGWILGEVLDWIEARKEERDARHAAPKNFFADVEA